MSVRIAALGMSKDKTSRRPYSEQDKAQRMVKASIMPTPLSAHNTLESRDGSDFQLFPEVAQMPFLIGYLEPKSPFLQKEI